MNQDELDRAIGAQRLILGEIMAGRTTTPVGRFSKLYSLYNGFMLGQFLIGSSLGFTRKTPGKVGEQVFRVNEFLDEIGVTQQLADEPAGFGTPEFQETVLGRIIPAVAAASTDVAEFALLSAHLVFYGHLVHFEADSIDLYRSEIERLRTKHGLPEMDFELLVPPLYADQEPPVLIDDVLNQALGYLERAVDALDPEPDSAFVVMPFDEPYAGRFHLLYRPALELAGLRAFRAWGGLSDERYCDMLLALIEKVGFVWADVSGLNPNVMYELGAAHARDRQALIVADASVGSTAGDVHVPANIGHDLVAAYSTEEPGWPELNVHAMAVVVAAMRSASERLGRHRVHRQLVTEVISEAAERASAGLPKDPE